MRLLYLTREASGSFRPDIATLFGQVLPQEGVCSDLVALAAPEPASWGGGKLFTRTGRGSLGRHWARLRLAIDLFGLARHGHYDAIQVRDRILGAAVGVLAARWRGIPFFYWMSFPFAELWQDMGSGRAESSVSLLGRLMWRVRGKIAGWLLYRCVLPNAAHVFVQSEAMGRMLEARGVPPGRMTPVPMGVSMPSAETDVAPADDPRLAGRRVVIYLGALERIRHPEIMLEAMCRVRVEAPDALLLLVGDSQIPGEREWLVGEIERLGLGEQVLVTGWLPFSDARRYLRSACIGLSPVPRSRILDVGSPTKVCEYLAYGIPVVANDQPDQAQLLAETGGGVSVDFSASGFAQAILSLLADPDRAVAMAQAGRAAVRGRRDYAVLGRHLAEVYRHLLKEPGKA